MAYSKTPAQELFEEDLPTNMATLARNLTALSPKDKDFARSLCSWYGRSGKLSEKQSYYAAKFWTEIHSTSPSHGRLVFSTPMNCGPIRDAFDLAKEKLKFPSLVFRGPEEEKIKFQLLTERSKTPGSILIVQEKNDVKIFLARIDRDANLTWEDGARYDESLQMYIKEITENYLSYSKMNGKEFGACCFCGLELTNKHSLHAGYGPICAANWGLPWGEEGEEGEESNDHPEIPNDLGLGDLV
jgi:hypothetical protein